MAMFNNRLYKLQLYFPDPVPEDRIPPLNFDFPGASVFIENEVYDLYRNVVTFNEAQGLLFTLKIRNMADSLDTRSICIAWRHISSVCCLKDAIEVREDDSAKDIVYTIPIAVTLNKRGGSFLHGVMDAFRGKQSSDPERKKMTLLFETMNPQCHMMNFAEMVRVCTGLPGVPRNTFVRGYTNYMPPAPTFRFMSIREACSILQDSDFCLRTLVTSKATEIHVVFLILPREVGDMPASQPDIVIHDDDEDKDREHNMTNIAHIIKAELKEEIPSYLVRCFHVDLKTYRRLGTSNSWFSDQIVDCMAAYYFLKYKAYDHGIALVPATLCNALTSLKIRPGHRHYPGAVLSLLNSRPSIRDNARAMLASLSTVIPCCIGKHWILIIIEDPRRAYETLGQSVAARAYKTRIIIADSRRDEKNHDVVKEIFSTFLMQSYEFLGPDLSLPVGYYNRSRVELVKAACPQQANDYDCGPFCLAFLKKFLKAYTSKEIDSPNYPCTVFNLEGGNMERVRQQVQAHYVHWGNMYAESGHTESVLEDDDTDE